MSNGRWTSHSYSVVDKAYIENLYKKALERSQVLTELNIENLEYTKRIYHVFEDCHMLDNGRRWEQDIWEKWCPSGIEDASTMEMVELPKRTTAGQSVTPQQSNRHSNTTLNQQTW